MNTGTGAIRVVQADEVTDKQEQQLNPLFELHRVGCFEVAGELLELSSQEASLSLFGNFVITRCEYLYDRQCFRYTAYSPLFRPASKACWPPFYKLTANANEDGNITLTATEQKDTNYFGVAGYISGLDE